MSSINILSSSNLEVDETVYDLLSYIAKFKLLTLANVLLQELPSYALPEDLSVAVTKLRASTRQADKMKLQKALLRITQLWWKHLPDATRTERIFGPRATAPLADAIASPPSTVQASITVHTQQPQATPASLSPSPRLMAARARLAELQKVYIKFLGTTTREEARQCNTIAQQAILKKKQDIVDVNVLQAQKVTDLNRTFNVSEDLTRQMEVCQEKKNKTN